MNIERAVRNTLEEWGDEAPHDPDLLTSVMLRAGSSTARRSNGSAQLRRIAIPSIALGVAAATAALGFNLLVPDQRSDVGAPSPTTTSRLSAAEVDELTTLGAEGLAWDDAKVERAWQQKWGVTDIAKVSNALRTAASSHSAADAGLSYDPQSLTYTQWVVQQSDEADPLREETQAAFEEVAGRSNLTLRFAASKTSLDSYQAILADLKVAAQGDSAWPKGLALTGEWSPQRGAFVLDAGRRAEDPDVAAYFERRWAGLVYVSSSVPATPQ